MFAALFTPARGPSNEPPRARRSSAAALSAHPPSAPRPSAPWTHQPKHNITQTECRHPHSLPWLPCAVVGLFSSPPPSQQQCRFAAGHHGCREEEARNRGCSCHRGPGCLCGQAQGRQSARHLRKFRGAVRGLPAWRSKGVPGDDPGGRQYQRPRQT